MANLHINVTSKGGVVEGIYVFNIDNPISNDESKWLGFGGTEFVITLSDGRVVTTNSLWSSFLRDGQTAVDATVTLK